MRSKLELIVKGGHVRRFHTLPTLTQETVGHHSYHVAWMCELISEGTPSAELLLAALQHDVAEHETGDLPAPAKRRLGIRKQFAAYESTIIQDHHGTDYSDLLSSAEVRTLSIADALAGLVLCVHERRLGNVYVEKARNNWNLYLEEFRPFSAKEQEILDILKGDWNEVHSK